MTPDSYTSPTLPADAARSSLCIPRLLVVLLLRWIGPVGIALVLFEGIVRTFIYSPRPVVSDRAFGELPAPASTWVNGREGFGRMHWNRQGLRGRDLPTGEPGNVHRILVLGDSYCRAEEVDDSQSFCAKLERELSRRLEQDVWIGNCGVGGLQAADYLYYLPAYQQRLHPELFVIAYSPGDFWVSDRTVLVGTTARLDLAAAFGGGITYQPPAGATRGIPGPLRYLVHHSGLAIYGLSRLLAIVSRGSEDDWQQSGREPRIATAEEMELYLSILVTLSHTAIVCAYINPYSPVQKFDSNLEEQRLREAADKLSIPFIGTGAAFRYHFARTGKPGNGFHWSDHGPGKGHLNATGHSIVAATLAPAITRLLADGSGPRSLRVAQRRAHALGIDTPPYPFTSPSHPRTPRRAAPALALHMNAIRISTTRPTKGTLSP